MVGPSKSAAGTLPATPLRRWGVALLQAFPVALGGYDIFLLLVQALASLAALAGIAIIISTPLFNLQRDWQRVISQLGDRRWLGRAWVGLGVALVLWSIWRATGDQLFSFLALVALAAAMLCVVGATYAHPMPFSDSAESA